MPDFISTDYYITFILRYIRKTTLFNAVKRAADKLRRFFLVGRIIKYAGIAVSVIEASAALVFVTALILAAIPIALIAVIIFAAADRIIGSRLLSDLRLSEYLSRKQVIVIREAGSFGEGFARELAQGGAAVFVITGDPSRRFICAREINGVYYLRHAFYFRLKRKRFNNMAEKLSYLL